MNKFKVGDCVYRNAHPSFGEIIGISYACYIIKWHDDFPETSREVISYIDGYFHKISKNKLLALAL